jgi:hypothetical protein
MPMFGWHGRVKFEIFRREVEWPLPMSKILAVPTQVGFLPTSHFRLHLVYICNKVRLLIFASSL